MKKTTLIKLPASRRNGGRLPTHPNPPRLDLGCGPNKKEGFYGVDSIAFPKVDQVVDLKGPWPWPENCIEEAHSSHCVEHFTAPERVHFYNELHRVLKKGAKATIVCPYWSSGRAYGDPTHQWPPISSFSFFYLLREWRMANAPHTDSSLLPKGYSCDFDVAWGFSLHPDIALRNTEAQQFAMNFYVESCPDVVATFTKR